MAHVEIEIHVAAVDHLLVLLLPPPVSLPPIRKPERKKKKGMLIYLPGRPLRLTPADDYITGHRPNSTAPHDL